MRCRWLPCDTGRSRDRPVHVEALLVVPSSGGDDEEVDGRSVCVWRSGWRVRMRERGRWLWLWLVVVVVVVVGVVMVMVMVVRVDVGRVWV